MNAVLDNIFVKNLLKSFSSDGRYVDNYKNRKMNRVGMPYKKGEHSQEGDDQNSNYKNFDLDSLKWEGGGMRGRIPSHAETKFGTLYSGRGGKFIKDKEGNEISLTDDQAKYFALTGKTKIPNFKNKRNSSKITSAIKQCIESHSAISVNNPNPNDNEISSLMIYPPSSKGGHKEEFTIVNKEDGSRCFISANNNAKDIAKQVNKIFKTHNFEIKPSNSSKDNKQNNVNKSKNKIEFNGNNVKITSQNGINTELSLGGYSNKSKYKAIHLMENVTSNVENAIKKEFSSIKNDKLRDFLIKSYCSSTMVELNREGVQIETSENVYWDTEDHAKKEGLNFEKIQDSLRHHDANLADKFENYSEKLYNKTDKLKRVEEEEDGNLNLEGYKNYKAKINNK